MSRDVPRRPVSSRTPTPRPRRVAGRGTAAGSAPEADEETTTTPDSTLETTPAETSPPETAPAETTPETESRDEAPERSQRGLGEVFAGRRTTTVLSAATVALALLAAGLGVWLWQHDEEPVPARPTDGAIAVPEGRPVLLSAADAQVAVAAAAEAASTIVATSYQDYDEQVEEAVALMTDAFAEEYRQTAEDVKQRILDTKTEVQVTIVAQGVVRANTSEVQGLLFLNQYSSKDGGDTTYTPYRALVTVVNTDAGWRVSGLDTQ